VAENPFIVNSIEESKDESVIEQNSCETSSQRPKQIAIPLPIPGPPTSSSSSFEQSSSQENKLDERGGDSSRHPKFADSSLSVNTLKSGLQKNGGGKSTFFKKSQQQKKE